MDRGGPDAQQASYRGPEAQAQGISAESGAVGPVQSANCCRSSSQLRSSRHRAEQRVSDYLPRRIVLPVHWPLGRYTNQILIFVVFGAAG